MRLPEKRPLIYLITAGKATPDNFPDSSKAMLDLIRMAVDEGVDLIQIREKELPARNLFGLSRSAAEITRSTPTKLLINDRADVAFAAGADGVHLARSSVPASVIRKNFPSNFVIGVSTHSLSEIEEAAANGADFAIFGPVFETPGKGPAVGIEVLAEVCRKVSPFPVLALGGVDEDNYPSVLTAGSSGFAAIRALNDLETLRNICKTDIKGMTSEEKQQPPVCLTIAGVDPSGGAGVYADIKTFSAFGCFATAAIASITFQNTTGVFGAEHQSAETLEKQLRPILDDYEIAALKTGMLPTREIISKTAELIGEYSLKNLVVDPVVRSTSGFDLIDDTALREVIERLFPLADLITPNIPEAERIAGSTIRTVEDVHIAAKKMQSMGARNVLIKGGHLSESEERRKAVDHLFIGEKVVAFESDYIETTATHGTGCTLAAAVTANLALGKDLEEAVRVAKDFVTEAIRTAPGLGKGHSPINI